MLRISCVIISFLALSTDGVLSQTVELKGQILATSDLENIHIINKTSRFYSTTNKKGEFSIKAKLNDTLVFSSIQYKLFSVRVTQENIDSRLLTVELEEFVNQLDEVLVGNTLTGNLEDDIKLSDAKPGINFYDVGIPGYKGKPKTKNERLLYEATTGSGFIPLNPILNGISGRTKMLKNRIRLEKKDELMFRIKAKFSKDLFAENPLPEENQMDYFYFCSDDPVFKEKCNSNNDLIILEFLKEKLLEYQSNQQIKTD